MSGDNLEVIRATTWSAGPGCHGGCGVLVHVKEGKVLKVEGDPDHPWNEAFDLIEKKMTGIRERSGAESMVFLQGTGRDIGGWIFPPKGAPQRPLSQARERASAKRRAAGLSHALRKS